MIGRSDGPDIFREYEKEEKKRQYQIRKWAKYALKCEGICPVTTAILFGTGSFFITFFASLSPAARDFFEFMVPFHPGYTYALPGALISAFWMFIYGHALGALFAFIYNSIKGE